ncbi:hypothetical protein CAPTEDRAFT_203074 [Capitella teleta]|uniref:Uncharacterized protein n=1 Tax=Capitella teleta TaxID=283909 RepID=R7T672_CAPTE|nr:hypothetical protein CAPTEDRAFT_203074 [Capitella teleta]|eukprot:ELT88910.1 hypothetical protein CAPTEDRAFT_203074 [Capitella teleta]
MESVKEVLLGTEVKLPQISSQSCCQTLIECGNEAQIFKVKQTTQGSMESVKEVLLGTEVKLPQISSQSCCQTLIECGNEAQIFKVKNKFQETTHMQTARLPVDFTEVNSLSAQAISSIFPNFTSRRL